jgi:Uma2 family endonuclease
MSEQQLLETQEFAIPDISQLEIEDDKPVDNFQSEKQQRLLVEPLYTNPVLTPPFIAAANVGLFYSRKEDPLVPDAFISLKVQMPADWSQKQNRSYFVWEFGKAPEVAIEIVSNRKGKELGDKKEDYARVGIAYYAVFDPLQQIQEAEQMNGALLRVYALTAGKYVEMTSPLWLETVGIGLTLWTGTFEEQPGLWLRWCDIEGNVIPTGKELSEQERLRAEQERQRAEQERQRATRLAERLREMGIDPDTI